MTQPIERVAVVGAGIAGLSIAIALHDAGVPVVVLEQASRLGEVGAGIGLTASSLRFFDEHGLGERILSTAVKADKGIVTYTLDGGRREAGHTGARSVHRRDLLDALLAGIPADRIRLGARVTGVTQDADGVTLVLADGSVERTAAVIGADGIHSVVQPAVTASAPPTFSGVVAYRGLVPAARLPRWPLDESRMFVGTGRHFLVFGVRRGELLNFVGFVPADFDVRESWSQPGDPARLAEEFAGFPEDVRRFIAEIDTTWRWGLHDHEPLERWTNGRIAVAGDAAHAMLPFAGMGANSAIEDAIVLGAVLADRSGPELPAALADYERIRADRARFVQRYTRRAGLLQDGHDERFAARDDLADAREVEAWLRRYDVRDAVAAWRSGDPLPALPAGAPV